jgi:hypothetical protein
MACPVRANESAPPATTTPPLKPDSPPSPPAPQLAKPPEQPAKPIEVKPVRETTDKIVIDDKQKTEGVTSNDAKAGHKDAAVQPETQKSLVPIVPVSSSHDRGNEVAGGAGIRRLPPVEATNQNAATRELTQTPNGSIPIYPTTGIE